MPKLIVYACPVGPLAQQIERYLTQAKERYGPNAAHAYMPHCTLTGFFEDEESSIPRYTKILGLVFNEYRDRIPIPAIQIKQLSFHADWHGLELEADWLKQLITEFARRSSSLTRDEALRLKDWLHLSLAYGFKPNQAAGLKQLAHQLIDISSEVSWELRFYSRLSGEESVSLVSLLVTPWECRGRWTL